jgi:hypothetical protein
VYYWDIHLLIHVTIPRKDIYKTKLQRKQKYDEGHAYNLKGVMLVGFDSLDDSDAT